MKSHHRTFVAIACVFIHSFDDDDDDDEMMMTRRVTLLRTVRDRSFARSVTISFVRSFVRSFVDARDARASTLYARMCEWMGGWVDRGAADDDDA